MTSSAFDLSAGLPRLLVDIRHEATHNELPSLGVLRLAAQSALNWLQDSYWGQQALHTAGSRAQIGAVLKVLANAIASCWLGQMQDEWNFHAE